MDDLWHDCSESTKEFFLYLIEKEEVLASESSSEEKSQLIEKGMAKIAKNKIIKNCRLMENYVLDKKQAIGNVAGLLKSVITTKSI